MPLKQNWTDRDTVTATFLNQLASAVNSAVASLAGKYTKPAGGIPASDLAGNVLDKTTADTIYATPAQVSAKYTKPEAGVPLTDLKKSDLDGVYSPKTRVTVAGFTDADIIAAFASGAASVYFPAGTWNVAQQFSIPSTVTDIELHPAATIIQTTENQIFVRTRSSTPASANVTAGATEGSLSITVDSTAGLAVGTWIKVRSEDQILGGATSKLGMIRRITAISGAVLTLDIPLHRSLMTSPTVQPCNFAPPLTLRGGGTIRQSDTLATTSRKSLVTFSHTDRPRVLGSLIFGPCGRGGVVFDSCMAPVWDGPEVFDLGLSGGTSRTGGQAITAAGATRDMRVVSGAATRVRHGFTTLPGGDTYGEPEGFVVETGFVVRGTSEMGLDTHEQGYGGIFRPNMGGGWQSIQVRSRAVTIEGGVVENTQNWGLAVRPAASETRVVNTRFRNSSTAGTVSTGGIVAESDVTFNNVSIDGFGSASGQSGLLVQGAGRVKGTLWINGRGGAGRGIYLDTPNNDVEVELSDIATGIVESPGQTGNSWTVRKASNVATLVAPQTYLRPKTSSELLSAVKTVDTTINNSSTLVADPELTVLAPAGAVYEVHAILHYEATTTADLKVGISAPSDATLKWGPNALVSSATATSGQIQTVTRGIAPGASISIGGAGAGSAMTCMAVGVLSLLTGGTVAVMWSQNTAEASDAIVRSLSSLVLRRIA